MRTLGYLLGLLASLLAGAVLFFLVMSFGNLFTYIGLVFSSGVEFANISAGEMKVFGNSSNMSSMLALGAMIGFGIFVMYLLAKLFE